MRKRELFRGECDTTFVATRCRAVICKEAIRRTRSSLLKLVRRIQFQQICGSMLRFYFQQLRDICDNSHINSLVTQYILLILLVIIINLS